MYLVWNSVVTRLLVVELLPVREQLEAAREQPIAAARQALYAQVFGPNGHPVGSLSRGEGIGFGVVRHVSIALSVWIPLFMGRG